VSDDEDDGDLPRAVNWLLIALAVLGGLGLIALYAFAVWMVRS
jgi:hypothetical protein